MMAASTVLSLVLLLMVGMQDQMSRAWTNANRRADATREASAACRLMAQDLSCLVFRSLATDTASSKQFAAGLSNQGVPFLYSSNGSVPVTFSIPSNQPGAAYFFAVTTRIPSTADPTDLSIVGYYIASETRTNLNGFSSTSYNLYRYYAPGTNAISNLKEWFNLPTDARKPTNLFKPNITNDEILARNTCNLRITVYNRIDGKSDGSSNRVANGLNYQFISGGGGTYYSGSKLQVEMSVYPEEFAQKIPYTSWTNSNNIKKYARSYEFRVDIPRD
ncbi:hypothetical protein EBX31_10400 [bacterium]|nr:hypothetical protein [bacterium]